MSDPGLDHARFDELAAGYALHALEQDEERRFLAHARHCPHCQQALADYAETAAALAETVPAAEPSPQLGPRILAAALARDPRPDPRGADRPGTQPAPGQPAPGAPVVPLRRRPRPRWLKATVAAAAAALIAGGTWAGLAASEGSSTPPLAACAHAGACPEIPLAGTAEHQIAARVIITAGSAWLLPAGLPANDTTSQVYVLWQITAAHAPLPVGSFDVRPGARQPLRIGPLAAPYHGTKAFAVSLEHGRAIPARPSDTVAQGQLPA